MEKNESKEVEVIEHDDSLPEVVSEQSKELQQSASTHLAAQSQADRLLEMAISNGTDMAQLEKLLELKEKYDREEARKAFTAALAAFKSEEISIKKDRTVGFNSNDGSQQINYSHASLGNIIKTATPVMSRHGLSARWLTEQGEGGVTVTCILTHKDGHSESTKLFAAPDNSGKKNAIQQVASTITYLERYTFLAITGLAVEEQDDDGASSAQEVAPVAIVSEDQALKLHSKIIDNGISMDIFMKWFLKAFKTIGCQSIDDLPVDLYGKVDGKIDETIANMKKS